MTARQQASHHTIPDPSKVDGLHVKRDSAYWIYLNASVLETTRDSVAKELEQALKNKRVPKVLSQSTTHEILRLVLSLNAMVMYQGALEEADNQTAFRDACSDILTIQSVCSNRSMIVWSD
ncbi:hypothetical protein [Caballeronia grimmiae]|uniref:Uncharacterized protein n=1 Tax=Caballeronia grimmiae TaxID=1071679 RepID=A0A069PI43_9BURK|nr:hypothetical protein [Caballeronia grimmiae]KDR37021.1 hypothetical protein BG57_09850 [Caballeronia grimmiae]GGD78406.1 hypothetical protein GCM10010985_36110 [Caballeronia grimmiae]